MFCSTLRKLPLWRTLGPLVASSSPWKLKESNLETHDLAIPMPYHDQGSYSMVLILGLTNMSEAGLADAKARIQLFAAALKGRVGTITLILKDDQDGQASLNGLEGFMRLQAILIEGDISCPVLPIPDVSSLLTTLSDYLKEAQPCPKQVQAPRLLTNLIGQATASAPAKPLSEHDANVVSDIFPSLQKFEEATRTQQGQAKLFNFLDRTTAENIIDFWADEWIV